MIDRGDFRISHIFPSSSCSVLLNLLFVLLGFILLPKGGRTWQDGRLSTSIINCEFESATTAAVNRNYQVLSHPNHRHFLNNVLVRVRPANHNIDHPANAGIISMSIQRYPRTRDQERVHRSRHNIFDRSHRIRRDAWRE